MVYSKKSMLGVPDMSGRNLKSLQGTDGHAPRRTLSTYDKMQEARARRAALFEAGDPANLPGPAQSPDPEPIPDTSQTEPDETSTPLPAERHAYTPVAPLEDYPEPMKRGSGSRKLILSLFILLIVLVGIAVYNIRTAEPVFEPTFAPPQVELGATGTGSPLLVAVGVGKDRSIKSGTHPYLATVSADRLPLSSTTPPLPAGPELFDDVETPQTPTRFPSGLTAITGKRPLGRPGPIGQ